MINLKILCITILLIIYKSPNPFYLKKKNLSTTLISCFCQIRYQRFFQVLSYVIKFLSLMILLLLLSSN